MDAPLRIYLDADACPVKDETYRVAARYGLKVFVVANSPILIPRAPDIERVTVAQGADVADDWIAERAGPGAIVVTADVPLASRCVKAGAEVLSPTGKRFSEASIGRDLRASQPPAPRRSARATARTFWARSTMRWRG